MSADLDIYDVKCQVEVPENPSSKLKKSASLTEKPRTKSEVENGSNDEIFSSLRTKGDTKTVFSPSPKGKRQDDNSRAQSNCPSDCARTLHSRACSTMRPRRGSRRGINNGCSGETGRGKNRLLFNVA